MYTLINNLTVSARLQVVAVLIVIFSIASALLLWNTSHSFNRDLNDVNAVADVELRVWQIRTNYNAMRGDIMQLYLADPATQGAYVEHALELMDERVKQIYEFNSGIRPEVFDEKTAQLYKPFNVALDDYVTYCQANLPAIKAVVHADSAERIRVRDVIVMESDRRYQKIRDLALAVIDGNRIHKEQLIQVVNSNQQRNLWFTLAISMALLVVTFFTIRMISRSILSPIHETEATLQQLSAGQLPETREFNGRDEFSRMLRSLQVFNVHMRRLMDFARQVANNNFTVQADMFDGQGPIAESLVSMRDNLQQAYTLELQRNWASRGLAELGDITRRQDDIQLMYDTLLSYLVKYLSANQGVLYIVDEENNTLSLSAAYAYGKKKHREAVLQAGEGLAGQAYLEKNMIVLKNVPKDYVHITSGLGDALPRMLIISPLISKEVVYGVLEFASFKEFEKHQLEFIQKISEELGSVIQAARVTTKTRLLLEGSQQQAEELKSQEEEMRQNMEELQATQEGMNRMLRDVQQKERVFTHTLDAIQAPIVVFDKQYTVVQVNSSMKRVYATRGIRVDVGTNLLTSASGDQGNVQDFYSRALQGEVFEYKRTEGDAGLVDAYSGIRNEDGEIVFGVVISYTSQH